MGFDANDLYRAFREKYRDSEPAKDIYRKLRSIRDEMIKESTDKADGFLDYFQSLPLDKQIDLLISLYELIFGKNA